MKPTNTLQYKNYLCQVSYSNLKDSLIGRILGMKQIPIFTAQTVAGIKESFHRAVDDYLTACAETGKSLQSRLPGCIRFALARLSKRH